MKSLLFIAVLFSVSSFAAMAQSSATSTASANVVQILKVGETSGPIKLGYILPGERKYLTPGNNVTHYDGSLNVVNSGITGSEERGYISITAASGTKLNLSIQVSSLTDDNQNTLNFQLKAINNKQLRSSIINGALTEDDPAVNDALTFFGSGQDFDLTDTWNLKSPMTMPAAGTIYMVLGGYVNAAINQTLGTYTGDITLTATITD